MRVATKYLRSSLLAFSALGSLALTGCATNPAPTTRTSDNPTAYAAANHPANRAAQERVAAAEANVQLAQSQLQPQLNLRANYTAFAYDQSASSPRNDALSLGIGVDVPVFDGFSRAANVKEAQALVSAENQSQRLTESNQLVQIATAIASLERSKTVAAARASHLQYLRNFLNDNIARAKTGEVSAAEIERLKGIIAKTTADDIYARAKVLQDTALLRSLGGNQDINTLKMPDLGTSLPNDESRAVEIALVESPAIREAVERSTAAGFGSDAALGEFAPKLSLSLDAQNGGTHFRNGTGTTALDASVKLGLTVPLFDGGRRSGQLDVQNARYRESQFNVDASRLQIEADVRSAWLQIQSANAASKLAGQQLAHARDFFDSTRQARQIGARTLSDELSARNDVTDAEIFLAEQRFTVATSEHRLLGLIGRLGPAYGLYAAN